MSTVVSGGSNNLMWWFGTADVYGYPVDLAKRLVEQAKSPDPPVIAGLLSPAK